MPERFRLPSAVYAIADTTQSFERPITTVVEEMAAAGIRVLQLRVKDHPADEFFRLARTARDLTRKSGCLLIINDRLDIALAVDADGVHLGQEDVPLTDARPLAKDKIIGVSTHSIEQARAAQEEGADYIGFGPVFGTHTKQTGYTPRGVSMLARVRRAVRIPIVAIGGIAAGNVADVWAAGADGAAMIGYLSRGKTRVRVKEVLELARKARG